MYESSGQSSMSPAVEDSLWRLRSDLLHWSRSTWALRATLVADWFSEEDRVYDDIELGSRLVVERDTTGPNSVDALDNSPDGGPRQRFIGI